MIPMSSRPHSVDGAMMDNSLQPAEHTAMVFLIGGCLAPYREKYFLHDVFGLCAFMQNTIRQRVGIAMITLVERFQGPLGPMADCRDQLFITWVLAYCNRLPLNLRSSFDFCNL